MMTFREEQLLKAHLPVEVDSVEVDATAEQVLEYLRVHKYMDADISGVTVTNSLLIVGMEFKKFIASGSDFHGGIQIKDCQFVDDLSFERAYVSPVFKLENIMVGSDLYLPQNLSHLVEEEIVCSDLRIRGKMIFSTP